MKKLLVLTLVLALLASVGILAGCSSGGTSSGGQTPEQAVQAFFDAAKKQDANTTWDLMSAATQKAMQSKANWETAIKQEAPANFTFKVGKATVNGDKATVEVTGTENGETSTQTFNLVKENGKWKLDLSGTATQ